MTSENCNLLIENLHELDLYENKIYCKGMLLVDPKNSNCAEEVVIVNVDAENSSASKESISPSLSPIRNIPGLVTEPKSKKKRSEEVKEVVKLKASDFLKTPRKDNNKLEASDFEFSDVSEYESCGESEGPGFFKKPRPKPSGLYKRNLSPEKTGRRVRSKSHS